MSAYSSFFVKPAQHEQIETVVHIKQDPRPAIIGHVKNSDDKPVPDAFVVIYETDGSSEIKDPLASAFTDDNGCFMFGPLSPGKLYQIKVCKHDTKWRILEPADKN